MTNKKVDHDLLIEIALDIKYIKRTIKDNQKKILWLMDENQCRKDWQEAADTKIKTYAGLATFIGGAIVFLADRVFSFLRG